MEKRTIINWLRHQLIQSRNGYRVDIPCVDGMEATLKLLEAPAIEFASVPASPAAACTVPQLREAVHSLKNHCDDTRKHGQAFNFSAFSYYGDKLSEILNYLTTTVPVVMPEEPTGEMLLAMYRGYASAIGPNPPTYSARADKLRSEYKELRAELLNPTPPKPKTKTVWCYTYKSSHGDLQQIYLNSPGAAEVSRASAISMNYTNISPIWSQEVPA